MMKKYICAFLLLVLLWTTQPSTQTTASNGESVLLLARATATSPHALYQITVDEQGHLTKTTLLTASEGYTLVNRTPDTLDFARSADEPPLRILVKTGERFILTDEPTPPADDPIQAWTSQILEQVTPLSGPRDFHPLPNDPTSVIFSMTGPTDNYLNLYWLDSADTIHPLTTVQKTGDASPQLLSASAEFLNWRPANFFQFLYRARQRDLQGQDHNELRLYSLSDFSDTPAPYFGKTPIWSPDGNWLAGERLNDSTPPLYILWRVELATEQAMEIGPGCNPLWSTSGDWLAYDGHDNSQWQGYTDCYANGRVYAQNITTGDIIELSAHIGGFVLQAGWMGG
ncbi:MAG: hypothetical protein HY862_21270 [Chloroflexi bacterium]|nr:hypothetical protein [Chloroflexota bacterium]